jgi:hypothetical protein
MTAAIFAAVLRDSRAAFCFFMLPSAFVSILQMDASLNVDTRVRDTAIVEILNMFIQGVLAMSIFLEGIKVTDVQKDIGPLEFSALGFLLPCIGTQGVFSVAHLVMVVCHPDRLATLRSALANVKVDRSSKISTSKQVSRMSSASSKTVLKMSGRGTFQIFPPTKPFEIETTDNVAKTLFGRKVANNAHALLKNPASQTILIVVTILGVTFGFLSVCEVVDKHYVWLTVLVLPWPFLAFLLLNVRVVRRLLRNIQVWYLLANTLGMLVTFAVGLGDVRAAFALCFFPIGVLPVLLDAWPAKARKMVTKHYFFFNLVTLILFQALTLLGGIRMKDVVYNVSHGQFKLSILSIYSSCSLNLVTFGVKNCGLIWMYPDCLVLSRSAFEYSSPPNKKVVAEKTSSGLSSSKYKVGPATAATKAAIATVISG